VVVRLRGTTDRPPAPRAAAVPAGKPLPGALEVVLGTKSSVLQPLTTLSHYTLLHDGDALALREEKPEGETRDGESPKGTPVAALSFDTKGRLRAEAGTGAQFVEIRGTNVGASNPRSLVLAPGERILCRVASADSPNPARLELVYHKERKA
jgi:hypothetical protein